MEKEITKILRKAGEPLETTEISAALEYRETRNKILGVLFKLMSAGKVRGKSVGSGKGAWIWWAGKRKN